MFVFLAFVSIFLGLNILHGEFWPILLITILFAIFLIKTFSKKEVAILLALIAISAGLSQVNVDYKPLDNVYSGIVLNTNDNYYLYSSGFETFYVYEKNNTKECGDIIRINGYIQQLSFVSIESEFDFGQYLKNKGVDHKLVVKEETYVFRSPIRTKLNKNNFLSSFSQDTKALVSLLLFSDRDYENGLINKASLLNVISLFSLSGIYINLLLTICRYILELKFSKKTSEIISFCLFIPIFFITFLKISLLRILFVNLLKIINRNFLHSKLEYIEIVSIVGLFLLLLNFSFAYQESFYLGFMISILVTFLKSTLSRFKKFFKGILVSLFIFIFFIPISANINHELHLLQVVFNSFLIPINLIGLMLTIFSYFIFPLTRMLNAFTFVINGTLEIMQIFDTPIYISNFTGFDNLIFYSVYLYFLYLFENKRFSHSRNVTFVEISFLLIKIYPFPQIMHNEVIFIDVGQGNSTLIIANNKVVMVDTGGSIYKDIATGTLIPFLKSKRIYQIDLLITSHDDFDHSGAKDSLIKNFKVKDYISDSSYFPINIGQTTIYNLNPIKNENSNDSSLVLYFELMNQKWLLEGDAGFQSEKAILENYQTLDVDILCVGHHGSETSTSEELIRQITPKKAVISVGKNNIYGHPNLSTLKTLEKYNCEIRRTDLEGTISYSKFKFF